MRRIEAIQWQTRESAANMLSLQIQAACAQTQFTRTGQAQQVSAHSDEIRVLLTFRLGNAFFSTYDRC